MPDKSHTSLSRMMAVLDLFDDASLARTAEQIAVELDLTLPTCYRYIRTLVEAGLLQRIEKSSYTLGPRVILLDFYIRNADPVLREGIPIMRELVEMTGFDCVASAVFGKQVLDTHREMGSSPAKLAYGRGRPRPLFQGAAPKVLVASLPRIQLHKLFDDHIAEIKTNQLPTGWNDFRRYYAKIRKAGHYVSRGELEPQLAAVAAPIEKAEGGSWGAISLVLEISRMGIVDMSKLVELVMDGAGRISRKLN